MVFWFQRHTHAARATSMSRIDNNNRVSDIDAAFILTDGIAFEYIENSNYKSVCSTLKQCGAMYR